MGVRKPNRETATIIHHTMERCVVCDAWYEWDYIQRRIDNPNTNIARKYCSHECYLKDRAVRKAMDVGGIWIHCMNCREWKQVKSRGFTFCSPKCADDFCTTRKVYMLDNNLLIERNTYDPWYEDVMSNL